MSDVIVNINRVSEARSVYRNAASDLSSTINNLKRSVERIEMQWKGMAKDSFENSHFPKLYESMKEHNKKIECLAKELDYIFEQFSSLDREITNRTR